MGLYLLTPHAGYNGGMPKINVYLPDDLADAVRDSGIPVSPICQRALEQAVRRSQAVRQAVLSDLTDTDLTERLQTVFTARAISVLGLAIERATSNVTTGDLLHGLVTEPGNLARQILTTMDIDPQSLTAPADAEAPLPEADDGGLRFSRPMAVALELTVGEAIGLGHNYVGCEHLLIGLVAEPDGAAGVLLRSRGLEVKAVRRSVAAAVAGYAHLRSTLQGAPAQPNALISVVRGEIAPLIARIERLEGAAGASL
ncbi:Clp protease N-terminal domain-containing protein [Actinoplanes sp. NPDC051343]|uniref:Clp protease N-terminal domain-containing protein n=1 Tax=Actinoplanes sp. NPDC051343 TaxID=3363906 RepID=UPI0037B69EFC